MASVTAVSRVLGLVRTILFAHILGVGYVADAFYLAFKIPNLFRRLFAEGAMSSAFVPSFSALLSRSDVNERRVVPSAESFFHAIFTLFFFMMLGVCGVFIFFSEEIIKLFYFMSPHQLTGERLESTSRFLQVMFPYLFFISLTALFQGLLNTYRDFVRPALTPVLLNITLISAASYLIAVRVPILPPAMLLSCAVTVGGVAQMLYLYVHVRKIGYGLRFRIGDSVREVKGFLLLMLPIFFSSSLYQINQILLDPIALSLGDGTLSTLLYAVRIQELPLGVVVVSISTVFLTQFSILASENRIDLLRVQLKKAFLILFVVVVPVITLGVDLSMDVSELIFSSPKIDREASSLIAGCLFYQLIAVLPIGMSRVFQSLFYSFKDTVTPVLYGFITSLFNFFLALFIVKKMGMGAVGLSFSSMFTAFVYCGLLYVQSIKKVGHPLDFSGIRFVILGFVFSLIALYLAHQGARLFESFYSFNVGGGVVQRKAIALQRIVVESLLFFGVLSVFLYLSKPKELIALGKDFEKRLKKS